MIYNNISDAEWESLWLRQARDGDVESIPPLAPAELQGRLHGTTGTDAMNGALAFRRRVLRVYGTPAPDARFLDFGCGWGRHLGVFLKDFAPENMYGVDIDSHNVQVCRSRLPRTNVLLNAENDALAIADETIDLIISFSVFSHINEESSKYWLTELYRVLKPDGMAVVTSWGANLLALFDRLDATGKTEYDWERNIDLSFPDRAKARSDYLSGVFVFGRHGNPGDNLDPDLYGITMIPRGWVEKETGFVIEEFLDNPQVVPQTTFFLRKSAPAAETGAVHSAASRHPA